MENELIHISLEQFLITSINKEKAYSKSISIEYNMQISSPIIDEEICEQDAIYCRKCMPVIDISIEKFKQQIMQQLKEGGSKVVNTIKDSDAVENAIVSCLENYGIPSHYIKIDDDTYLVADADAMKMRLLSPTSGAVLVYSPLKIVIIKY